MSFAVSGPARPPRTTLYNALLQAELWLIENRNKQASDRRILGQQLIGITEFVAQSNRVKVESMVQLEHASVAIASSCIYSSNELAEQY